MLGAVRDKQEADGLFQEDVKGGPAEPIALGGHEAGVPRGRLPALASWQAAGVPDGPGRR